MTTRRLIVIACPSLQSDLQILAAKAGSEVSFLHLETGLHERPASELRMALQAAIDQAAMCDAVVLAYGLCSRSAIGLAATSVPVVIPRAHDCIALMLGSCGRYLDEIERQPGTYFQSAGWLKAVHGAPSTKLTFGPNGNVALADLAERFGQDAADYLLNEFANLMRLYRRLAYIATPSTDAQKWEAESHAIADEHRWSFDRLEGDTGWMERMLEGIWQEHEFLVVRPGQRVVQTTDRRLIAAEAA